MSAPIIAGAKPFALVLKLLGLTATPVVGGRGTLTVKKGAVTVQTGFQNAIVQWMKRTRLIQ